MGGNSVKELVWGPFEWHMTFTLYSELSCQHQSVLEKMKQLEAQNEALSSTTGKMTEELRMVEAKRKKLQQEVLFPSFTLLMWSHWTFLEFGSIFWAWWPRNLWWQFKFDCLSCLNYLYVSGVWVRSSVQASGVEGERSGGSDQRSGDQAEEGAGDNQDDPQPDRTHQARVMTTSYWFNTCSMHS